MSALHPASLVTVVLLSMLAPLYNAAADTAAEVAAYDALLAAVQPGQTTVAMGDMIVPVEKVRRWREAIARGRTRAATETGVTLWPGGNAYYAFNANVSAAKRQLFRDAAAEWSVWANVRFIERTSQVDYIQVNDVVGLAGGNSHVGRTGGAQPLNMGSTSWNRATLLHEMGHALGLIHEHQRSDRDTYVTVNFSNAPGGTSDGNYVRIPGSINTGDYDFLSVMHYARRSFAVNPNVDVMTPKAGYTEFADLMGTSPNDHVLSRGDREGIAELYGAGPAVNTTVTNTNDSGLGSLRTAIYRAFDLATDSPAVMQAVSFAIPSADAGHAAGVWTIRPSARLPGLGTKVAVNGGSQTTFAGNPNAAGPEIALEGTGIAADEGYGVGLRFFGSGASASGLAIRNFSTWGILITGAGATGNTVAGCYIGTNAAGAAAAPNAFAGIEINSGATGNLIGGATTAARNVIAGNTAQGIYITGSATTGNVIQGNYVGLNAAGTAALANGYSGIAIGEGADNNVIGGTASAERNVISGNTAQGIFINNAGTTGNLVRGNYIGTNAAGADDIPNGYAGVEISGGASGNTIGNGNVISGNTIQGVALTSANTTGNVVFGNIIGATANGSAALPNAGGGIQIFGGASNNTIGGTTAGAGNVISGNASMGIGLFNATTIGNLIAGNFIGLNSAGTAALANAGPGIYIGSSANNNTIGSTLAAGRNVISGNAAQGIGIANAGSTGNRVIGNYIGVNPAGTSALPNAFSGIDIFEGAASNFIGSLEPGGGNVISGNSSYGLTLSSTGTSSNVVGGNLIGLSASGLAALPNGNTGVAIYGRASTNVIGPRNYISSNTGYGISISDTASEANQVRGNVIGAGVDGAARGNNSIGVVIFGGADNNTIGGTAAGAANVIANNAGAGVAVYDTTSAGNRIATNVIRANAGLGIDLVSSANSSQSAPVLSSAVLGTATTVQGSLQSTASATFRIEFFANSTADSSNAGEGAIYLGATDVTTNGSGTATINAALPVRVPAGYRVSATATSPAGNTSEFAVNATVTTADTDSDGLPNAYETANSLQVNVADGTSDADGDGRSNLAEFRSGTNPRDPASVFRLAAPARSGNDLVLTLGGVVGQVYTIEYADSLTDPAPWKFLATSLVREAAPLTVTDPGAATRGQRFYRATPVIPVP